MKKVILWDNDGVLVDTEKYYLEANRIVLSELGIEVTTKTYESISLNQGKSILELARTKGMNDEEILRLRDKRDEIYVSLISEKEIEVEHAEDILRNLFGKFAMGIVTSTKREYFNLIHQRTGFLKYFDFVVAREDYKKAKPDPEPYIAGINKSSAAKDEIIAIEDSERGLSSALAAGIDCLIIPNELTKPGKFYGATKILGNINEVNESLIYSIS